MLLYKVIKKIISRFEIILASVGFLLLLLVLSFRNIMSISSKILVFIQEKSLNNDTLANVAQRILKWISTNSQWTGEGAQWLWVWFVMLGVSESERCRENLKIDFFFKKISSQNIKLLLQMILDGIFLLTNVFLFLLSFQELQRSAGSTPTTLPMSNAWLYASMTIGLLCLSVRISMRIVINVRNFAFRKSCKAMHDLKNQG